jgi:hypothetical protein
VQCWLTTPHFDEDIDRWRRRLFDLLKDIVSSATFSSYAKDDLYLRVRTLRMGKRGILPNCLAVALFTQDLLDVLRVREPFEHRELIPNTPYPHATFLLRSFDRGKWSFMPDLQSPLNIHLSDERSMFSRHARI